MPACRWCTLLPPKFGRVEFDRQNVALVTGELVSYIDLRLRVRPWPPSDGGSQTGRYLCLRAADWRTSRHPSSVSSGLRWPQAGVRWCGVFQVVKTAQSRGRTERTLLKALSQLLWPDKGREVWFSLRESHEKACRFPDFLQRCTGQEQ